MTLRMRLTIIPILTALLIAVAMMFANGLTNDLAEQRFSEAMNRGKTVLWNNIIDSQINSMQLGMRNLGRDRRTLEALKDADTDAVADNAMSTYLRLSNAQLITGLLLTDTSGKVAWYSDGDISGKTSIPLVAQVLADKKTVRGISRDDNGKLLSMLAFPLYLSGEFVGVAVYLHHLHSVIQEFKQSDASEIFIINQDGDIDSANILLDEGQISSNEYSTNSELLETLALEDVSGMADKTITRKAGGKVFSVSTIKIKDISDQTTAYLVSVIDATESYQAVASTRSLSYTLILLGILIAGLLAFLYVRRLFQPIDRLMRTVKKLAHGDNSARTGVTGNDEIGQLGTAFNKMAQTIQDDISHAVQQKEDVEGKVGILLDTVESIASGDLTAEMMVFSDNDDIAHLAMGIEKMIDNLNLLVSDVQKSGIQVTSSTTQIAATSREQETTVGEQAAYTNEIMSTASEISATTKELVNTMTEVSGIANDTAQSASEGQSGLAKMEQTMRQMKEATDSITSKLAVLSEKAGNINTVVTTINKVADQTNLLSLNAAIEAEKAGEYGLGFAVVATEIRRLADQTAVATWDIEQMVKEMQSAVSAGVMGMDKFSEEVSRGVNEISQVGSQLARIIEQVQTVSPRVETVAEGMKSQSVGAEQISESMVQLNEMAKQTVASLEQSNESIQHLKEAAQILQAGVSQFKVS